jgi:hypothetical protein
LAAKHPQVAEPADLSRAIALEYVAAVDRMIIGEWANPDANYVRPLGKRLKPTAKASHLSAMRHFIRDLQEWEWIPRRFDPARALALPRSVRALIGPAPRVVADDQWAKLVWAGMNLAADDVWVVAPGASKAPPAYYPIEMIRALAHLWLFGALRSDEIHRLPVGCIRWQRDVGAEATSVPTCLLDVPVNKTAWARQSRPGSERGSPTRACSTGKPARWSTTSSSTADVGSRETTSTDRSSRFSVPRQACPSLTRAAASRVTGHARRSRLSSTTPRNR